MRAGRSTVGCRPTGLADGLARPIRATGRQCPDSPQDARRRPIGSPAPPDPGSGFGLGVVNARQYMHRRRTARSRRPGRAGRCRYHRPPPRPPARPFSRREDLRRHPTRPRAQLAARRRRRADPRPARDPDRRRAARQAQARVHAARRHRRLRRRRQRREDRGHRQQARREEVLPPLRLPGRPQVADARRHARAPARGGHPPRGQGHAAPQPPRPQAAHQAQGLRRARAPARGAEAAAAWRSRPDGRRPNAEHEETAGGRSPARRGGAAPPPPSEPAAEEAPPPPRRRPSRRPPPPRSARRGDPVGRGRAGAAPPRSPPPRSAAAERGRGGRRGRRATRPRASSRRSPAPTSRSTSSRGRRRRWPRGRATYAEEADAGDRRGGSPTQPIAAAAIDLAAGARYRATGKRKTADRPRDPEARHRRLHDQRPHARRLLPAPDAAAQHPPAARDRRLRGRAWTSSPACTAAACRPRPAPCATASRRALLEADPNLRGELKRRGFLTRDARVKERKKAGLKKARKRPQFSKR